MGETLSEREMLELLGQIERGSVTLTSETEPQVVRTGYVDYQASNGWRLRVFAADGEWDHLAELETDDERRADREALRAFGRVYHYLPSPATTWRCYGLPGPGQQRDEVWPGTLSDEEQGE